MARLTTAQAVSNMMAQQSQQAKQRLVEMSAPSARSAKAQTRAADIEAHRQKQAILDRNKRPENVRHYSTAEWHARFEREGHDVILNAIACGYTLAAWAVERGFPPLLFAEWCEENLDRKRVVAANRVAADLAAHESITIFDNPESNVTMQAVHHARARAQHKTWLAERRDADRWGPPKAVPPQQAPVALNVYMGTGDVPSEVLAEIADKKAAKLARAPERFDPNKDRIAKRSDAEDAEEV